MSEPVQNTSEAVSDDWTLEVWAEDAKRRVDDFVAMWKREHIQRPEMYPMILPAGEWDDQFRCVEGG